MTLTCSACFLLIFVLFQIRCDTVDHSSVNSCYSCTTNNSTCHIISGLFTRLQLPFGYNMITQIPRGACNLSISEMSRSRNYLALRRQDGSFVINGNWALNWSGHYLSNGTTFVYFQENGTKLESIYSLGPLQERLDLMIIFQQPNPGIKYSYQLPMKKPESDKFLLKDDPVIASYIRETSDVGKTSSNTVDNENRINNAMRYDKPPFSFDVLEKNQHEGDKKQRVIKGRKKKFVWNITGYTECSRTCGGGTQTSVIQCVRLHNQVPVSARRCAAQRKPFSHKLRCNIKPCPAQWVGGEWNKCSVSCGEGVQRRSVVCKQKISPTLILNVDDAACLTPPSPLIYTTRPCTMPTCNRDFNEIGLYSYEGWFIGEWSECSTTCGLGLQTRLVTCLSHNCSLTDKPTPQSVCDMGSCGSPKWFYTDWSNQCSSSCGTGKQTRKVLCTGIKSECDLETQPPSSRPCSSDTNCSQQWYSEPWSQCSAKCGWGKQTRSIVCLIKQNNELIVTSESQCLYIKKPLPEQECYIQACEPEWYTSDWSECSKTCDAGIQMREVQCFDEKHRVVNGCHNESAPSGRQSCNTHRCSSPDEVSRNISYIETFKSTTEDTTSLDEPVSNDIEECIDIFTNCHLVVQARLCRYKYYNSFCCNSCLNRI